MSEGQGGGIPCSILVSVVPVFSDSCSGRSGCSGGFVPVVPVVSFRLFRVLVHAHILILVLFANCVSEYSHFYDQKLCKNRSIIKIQ